MNKKSVTLGVALLMSGVAMAQTAVLGHVSDSEGTPIVNAAVRIGTRTVALTDGKGNFSLAKVPRHQNAHGRLRGHEAPHDGD